MIRRRTVAVLFLVFLAAVSTGSARLPQWASDLAGSAPPLPEGVPEDDFRTVLQELSVEVHPDGRLTKRMRVIRQVLVSTAWYAGVEHFNSGDNRAIKKLNAWHLPPKEAGKRRVAEKSKKNEQVVITLDDSFTTDSLNHLVGGWDIRPGSLVFFEAVSTESPYDLTLSQFFVLGGPLVQGRVQVVHPAGWTVLSEWLHYEGPEPAISSGMQTWEISDLPSLDVEELGESLVERSPILHLSLAAPAGVDTVGASLPDLPAVAGWYDELAQGLSAPDDAIRSAAATLASDGDFVSDLTSMASAVRDKVRYIAKEVGIEGYKPRPAKDTWSNLYGDCKDKATLLESMLDTQEIRSYQVWVNASHRGLASKKVPGPGLFNHQILAVSLPGGQDQALPDLPAVAPDSPFGPLMIIDTTDSTTTPGWLPSHLAGKSALVLSDSDGFILELPAWKPEAHRFERVVRVRPLEGGVWSFSREERLYGEYASNGRSGYRSSAADLETSTFRLIKHYWTGAEPGQFEVDEEQADGAYVESVDWTVAKLPGRFEDLELHAFPEANNIVPTVSVTRRTIPVVYGFPRMISLTIIAEGLPPETSFPEPARREGDGWSVQTDWIRDEDQIRGTMNFVMEKTRYTQEEFRDLRRMFAALKKQASALIRVPRGS